MHNLTIKRMLGASTLLASLLAPTALFAADKQAATTSPKSTPRASTAVKPTKSTPPAAVATTPADSKKSAEAPSIAGSYEAGGNLLSIIRYMQGRSDEFLITYTPDTRKSGEYCSFFSAPTIPGGATTFTAHRYSAPGLPGGPSNCMMRIKADGAKAEIVDMSPECRQLCKDPQTFTNPGPLKRAVDE